MKSYDFNHHGASDQLTGQAKKPWVTPSLQIIALESATGGTSKVPRDGSGAHGLRPKS